MVRVYHTCGPTKPSRDYSMDNVNFSRPRGACSCPIQCIASTECTVWLTNHNLKSSHQPILLAKKGAIIKAIDNKKKSRYLIAQEFGVAKSTVSTIMEDKADNRFCQNL